MGVQSQPRPLRRKARRIRVGEPRFGMVVLVAAVATAAGAVTLGGLALAFRVRPGPQPVTFLAGIALCAAGLYMFQRGLRRRARLRAIDQLLPHHRERLRHRELADAAAAQTRRFIDDRMWTGDETEWGDDGGDPPLGRSEMRAATRALLVSLEEEMRREALVRGAGPARPACRRARLRAAGRAKTTRRRPHRARAAAVRSLS